MLKLSFFHPAKFIGTWFGVGLVPKAPGTFGSIAALPFAWAIESYGSHSALLIASIITFFIGWIACHLYLPYTQSQDPKEMVIDEVSAQWLLLSFMPQTAISFAAGLVLFRFFDIIKPWPVSLSDRKIHGGFGVMFDDTLAALYPLALFWILHLVGWGEPILAFLAK